jgi:hypothetical protein
MRRRRPRQEEGVGTGDPGQFFLITSTPLTRPTQVSPEYGTRIESTPSSAVPVSVMGHAGNPGTEAAAWAFHAIVEPARLPLAVPATLSPPAHVALNVPLALLPVCSVTLHLKFEQAPGVGSDGAAVDDDQVPSSAATPVAEGPTVLVRS